MISQTEPNPDNYPDGIDDEDFQAEWNEWKDEYPWLAKRAVQERQEY